MCRYSRGRYYFFVCLFWYFTIWSDHILKHRWATHEILFHWDDVVFWKITINISFKDSIDKIAPNPLHLKINKSLSLNICYKSENKASLKSANLSVKGGIHSRCSIQTNRHSCSSFFCVLKFLLLSCILHLIRSKGLSRYFKLELHMVNTEEYIRKTTSTIPLLQNSKLFADTAGAFSLESWYSYLSTFVQQRTVCCVINACSSQAFVLLVWGITVTTLQAIKW